MTTARVHSRAWTGLFAIAAVMAATLLLMPSVHASDQEDDGDEESGALEPIPDDGGADEACGSDRRCRIDRIAARNQMRRYYRVADQQQAVYDEVDDMMAEEERPATNREADPWNVAIQRHQFGAGIAGDYTFSGHFRAGASLVYQDRRIRHSSDVDGVEDISGNQSAFFTTAHVSFLPARAWLSPILSVGFGIGGGEFGSTDVSYHYVTASIGAEAQLDSGFLFRLGYRDALLLYNQARNGPGNYDDERRAGLREYMHDEGLGGIDFSIGWAF